MKKIFTIFATALIFGYFFHNQKNNAKNTSDAWEETLDSIATTQVEEMFLLLEMYSDQEWLRVEKIYYHEDFSWSAFRIKLQPMNNWGRFIDITTSKSMVYRCSECNDNLCFSDEVRIRWYKKIPHIRLKKDFAYIQVFKNSCSQGEKYKYSSFNSFCLDVKTRAEKITQLLLEECASTE
jgi:hypothetical protein